MTTMTMSHDLKCQSCEKRASWRATGRSGRLYAACREHQEAVKAAALRSELRKAGRLP